MCVFVCVSGCGRVCVFPVVCVVGVGCWLLVVVVVVVVVVCCCCWFVCCCVL